MLNCEFSYSFHLISNGHAMRCTQVLKYGRSSRRRLGVQLHCSCYRHPRLLQCGYHILDSVKAQKENIETPEINLRSLSESTETRADEDVDDRPSWTPTTRGRPNLSAVSVMYNILIRSNCTRTSHMRDLFAFYSTPNDRISNYILPFG